MAFWILLSLFSDTEQEAAQPQQSPADQGGEG